MKKYILIAPNPAAYPTENKWGIALLTQDEFEDTVTPIRVGLVKSDAEDMLTLWNSRGES
jgi:hypothetical protein